MLFWQKWRQNRAQQSLQREQIMQLHDQIVDHLLILSQDDQLGVEDGYELRFDLMVFFASYLLFIHKSKVEFCQALWDMVFEGFRESLRVRGVTDIRMGARMKKAYRDATGRRDVYIEAWEKRDDFALREAVKRNILNNQENCDAQIEQIVGALQTLPGIEKE